MAHIKFIDFDVFSDVLTFVQHICENKDSKYRHF